MRRYYRIGVQAYMLILNNCRNILLHDISIVHSPLWESRFVVAETWRGMMRRG